MTTYTPAPGTVAFRVIGWLEEQGATKEFNASQIANALDLDPKTITTCLQNALDTGLVFRRQKDRTHQRAPVWWSLTNHGLRQRMEMSPNPVGWMTRPPKDDDEVPTFRGRATDTPKGDQPRSERGRGVMEPAVCESADGRGTTGAPALATLPQHASPGVGPMGAGQPADAGPTTDESAAQQEAPPNPGSVEPAAPPVAPPPAAAHERPREVDAQFARSIDKALADPEVRFALWDDDRLICVANGAVLLRCTPEQTHRLRQLLGGA